MAERWRHVRWIMGRYGHRRVAWASLPRLAQRLRRPGAGPVHPLVPPQAAAPADAGTAPAIPASPLRLEAIETHDRNPVATRVHPPPMAGPAVCRQSPEVGAGWLGDQVLICVGGRSNAHSYRNSVRHGSEAVSPELQASIKLKSRCLSGIAYGQAKHLVGLFPGLGCLLGGVFVSAEAATSGTHLSATRCAPAPSRLRAPSAWCRD